MSKLTLRYPDLVVIETHQNTPGKVTAFVVVGDHGDTPLARNVYEIRGFIRKHDTLPKWLAKHLDAVPS